MDVNNNEKLSNKKNLFLVLVIFLISMVVIGGTYAYMTFSINITNNTIAYNTTCFNIVYDADNDETPITGTLIPSSGPGGGLSGKISLGLASKCTNIDAYGNFNLNISSADDILFQTVDAHCENPYTLRTLTKYTDEASCVNEGGKWVTNGTAFKYAIYTVNDTSSAVPIKKGYLSSNADTVLYEDFAVLNQTVNYYFYVWLDGNLSDNTYSGQSFSGNISVGVSQITSNNGEPNAPVLDPGMIPVTIDDYGNVTTISEDDSNWYNYSNRQWANVVLVNSNSRSNYLGTTGKTINQSDILAYYVWIPRYKYKIWTVDATQTTSPQTIDIVFEPKSANKTSGTKVGMYYTHPAFIFGGENLAGIWVGKFEATGDATTPTILPSKRTLVEQRVSVQFTTSLKFAGGVQSGSSVTFMGSNVYGLISTTDSHMMKNSEWGAVAYLSHSKYGINREVRLNNNSSVITGCGASEENGIVTSECQIAYGSGVSFYPQSTTGNITGVFDMSGGAVEYVMAVLADSSGNPMSGNSSDWHSGFNGTLNDANANEDGIDFPDSKYYDLYLRSRFNGDKSVNGLLCTLEACGGHALYETAGWYENINLYIDSYSAWFLRGGYYFEGNSITTGMFGFYDDVGDLYTVYSWRSVVVVD